MLFRVTIVPLVYKSLNMKKMIFSLSVSHTYTNKKVWMSYNDITKQRPEHPYNEIIFIQKIKHMK